MNTEPDEASEPREPHLDHLLGLLTAAPTRAERAGQEAALAMFRAAAESAAPTGELAVPAAAPAWPSTSAWPPTAAWPAGPAAPDPAPRRRAGWGARRARLLTAAASLVIVGGFATAAYAAALPDPVQHVAYRALGFAGVPDAPGAASAPRSSGTGVPPRARGARRAPGRGRAAGYSPRPRAIAAGAAPGRSGTAPSRPGGTGSLSVSVARGVIAAGGADVIVGRRTELGAAVPAAQLSLLERTPGQPGWRLAGTATTGAGGQADLDITGLITNAVFRVTGPGGTRSQPVLVIVVPPVTASLAGTAGGRAGLLTVRSPLAAPGDAVVVQVRLGGDWRSVQVGRLGGGAQVSFPVRAGLRRRVYRVVVPATLRHGRSVSNPVTVPSGASLGRGTSAAWPAGPSRNR